ncbi:antibiotic biosynthesis monooxygenase [Paenibacillus rhizosphaerae]|uniref:Antibiotic biosynthesis monooxygenase n=1 Tax=Paenibacillus rhizosphaerae TaxID=297318 RepID=A0A1R1EZ64_9BACL|nr:putative quinol monooxygenase [Paenibacillus rhizosphaerae]OMF57109.1 antibiotic biosynthesis monooxygenase [Paenibacillus rhizosphaerae]
MIIVHAKLDILPEQEERFLKEANSLLAATRAEEGNISYELFKSVEQEHYYTMVEIWKDFGAVQAHNSSDHFQAFVQTAKTLLASPMELKVFQGEPVQA